MLSGWPVTKLSRPTTCVAVVQEAVGEVGAEEARRAGDQDAHVVTRPVRPPAWPAVEPPARAGRPIES